MANEMNNPFSLLASYYRGAIQSAFAVFLFGGVYTEQQIDLVKESILRYRESEIDQSPLTRQEKEAAKMRDKAELEARVQGVKDELRRLGRLVKC